MSRTVRRILVVLATVLILVVGGLSVAVVVAARANGATAGEVLEVAGYWLSRLGKTPRPAPEPAADRDGRWRQDLAYLASELPRLHANAFHTTSREDFRTAVETLERRVSELDDARIEVELMRIIALVGDGHTTSWSWTQRFRRFPVIFRWFGEDLYVVAADRTHTGLLGARVLAVGAASPAEALAAVAPLASSQSEGDLRARAAGLLARGEVLYAVGLQKSPERGTFLLEDAGGRRTSPTLEALPPDASVAWQNAGPVPLYRSRPEESFWTIVFEEEQVVYLRYGRARDADGFRAVAGEVLAGLDARPEARLVVDLRGNGGGDERVLQPLLEGIRERELGARGRLLALIDGGTFSSATGNAGSLRELGARLLGEPTGDGLDGYGQIQRFILPASGIEVQFSTRYWRRVGSEAPLEPDLLVRPAIEDVLAGRDPVLEAALAAAQR